MKLICNFELNQAFSHTSNISGPFNNHNFRDYNIVKIDWRRDELSGVNRLSPKQNSITQLFYHNIEMCDE